MQNSYSGLLGSQGILEWNFDGQWLWAWCNQADLDNWAGLDSRVGSDSQVDLGSWVDSDRWVDSDSRVDSDSLVGSDSRVGSGNQAEKQNLAGSLGNLVRTTVGMSDLVLGAGSQEPAGQLVALHRQHPSGNLLCLGMGSLDNPAEEDKRSHFRPGNSLYLAISGTELSMLLVHTTITTSVLAPL